jgi:hypothetical protein
MRGQDRQRTYNSPLTTTPTRCGWESYTPSINYGAMRVDRERNELRLIGIGQSSTFNCFCQKHDSSLFSDIENKPLIFGSKQLALLHYRAFAMELYKMLSSLRHTEAEAARSKSSPFLTSQYQREIEFTAISGIEVAESKRMIDTHNYDDMCGLVLYFKKLPSVMVVGGIQPEFDFDQSVLRTKRTIIPSSVSFNVLAAGNRAVLVLTWLKGHPRAFTFANSLLKKDSAIYTTLIIQAALEFIENICISPTWWTELKPTLRNSLAYRLHYSDGILLSRKPNCLSFPGVTYDDWDFERHETVGWVSAEGA